MHKVTTKKDWLEKFNRNIIPKYQGNSLRLNEQKPHVIAFCHRVRQIQEYKEVEKTEWLLFLDGVEENGEEITGAWAVRRMADMFRMKEMLTDIFGAKLWVMFPVNNGGRNFLVKPEGK